ncbi:phosphoribosylanthranilate isomerase [Sphingomonas crocodyli]|uniref:N-(5'-phosphoribosyl)anthranilate isomerase n=1 Tax=Sphingomonas crocodyli TaxID=1979270 RepID=A0A437M4Q3_9SPHN|nr:phosphoribosylanthranilate isomerase [Sphingomonas crocodyli]RVT92701.1 phosphoribosylanthranilate isomerase [Sphingomonas crocodyli]
MQRVTAKICGLSTPETVGAAVRHGASHVGFMFFPKSPRNVEPEQAAQLAAIVPAHVVKVGVLVDPDDEMVARAVASGLDAIQLHGGEAPDRVAALKARHGIEAWKVLSVRTRADLDKARAYKGAADRILYDAKTPEGALPGGMGLRFDWTLLDGFAHPLPWALAGGIDVANVGDAAGRTGARLIDVSSGVESAPGVKDVDKIAAFLQRVAQL